MGTPSDLDTISTLLSLPVQVGALGVLYWLFSRTTDRLQQTWEKYAASMDTIVKSNTTALVEMGVAIRNMQAEINQHIAEEDRLFRDALAMVANASRKKGD